MKIDENPVNAKIPICIISKLRDDYKGDKNDLIECILINYKQGDYNSVALQINGYNNTASQYGYYYAKRKELEKFIETGEYQKMENKEFNYYYSVEYLERNLIKIIPANKAYNINDYLVITSSSAKYCVVKVTGITTKDQIDENKKPRILDRRIICKVEDTYGIKLARLEEIQLEIKAINHTISDKYLLI